MKASTASAFLMFENCHENDARRYLTFVTILMDSHIMQHQANETRFGPLKVMRHTPDVNCIHLSHVCAPSMLWQQSHLFLLCITMCLIYFTFVEWNDDDWRCERCGSGPKKKRARCTNSIEWNVKFNSVELKHLPVIYRSHFTSITIH